MRAGDEVREEVLSDTLHSGGYGAEPLELGDVVRELCAGGVRLKVVRS